jgi:hypothetical protein
MSIDDVTFVYEKNILPLDKEFISSFKFPKKIQKNTLDNFVNDVYKLESIKRTVSSLDTSKSPELFSLVTEIFKTNDALKNYIDSSIKNLAYMSSQNQAQQNVTYLSYFHTASKIISHSSHGVNSLENDVLRSANNYFSTNQNQTNLYFVGDSFVVDKSVLIRDAPVDKSSSRHSSRVLFLAFSFFIIGAVTCNYFHKKAHENSKDIKPKTEQYQSKESDKYDAKPVAKYEN